MGSLRVGTNTPAELGPGHQLGSLGSALLHGLLIVDRTGGGRASRGPGPSGATRQRCPWAQNNLPKTTEHTTWANPCPEFLGSLMSSPQQSSIQAWAWPVTASCHFLLLPPWKDSASCQEQVLEPQPGLIHASWSLTTGAQPPPCLMDGMTAGPPSTVTAESRADPSRFRLLPCQHPHFSLPFFSHLWLPAQCPF